MLVRNQVLNVKNSSEGHFSENDPIIQVPAAAEQLAFLIHSVGGDI